MNKLSSSAPSLNFCLSSDANYYEGLETALTSAIVSSRHSTKHFNCYIIDGGLESGQKKQLESHLLTISKKYSLTTNLQWLYVDQDTIKKLEQLEGSYTYYVRLFLPDLIPNESWVIWIDSDIFCLKDFAPTFGLDEDTPLYAAIDSEISTLEFESLKPCQLNTKDLDLETPYVNTGVSYFNLDLWRKEKLTESLMKWGYEKRDHLLLFDQSITNWNLADRIKHLPRDYNVLCRAAELIGDLSSTAINYHFAGSYKPWRLNFKVDLKHASIAYCQLVMTFHYLNFRANELNDDQVDSREKVRLEAKKLLRFLDRPFAYHLCLLRLLFYKIKGAKRRYKLWLENAKFYRELRKTVTKNLRTIQGTKAS